jgi:hypothetical protein
MEISYKFSLNNKLKGYKIILSFIIKQSNSSLSIKLYFEIISFN